MPKVKSLRTYAGQARKEQADATRVRIIDVARAEFLEKGYGTATISSIATRARVSVETIYKSFGGKAGLIRAIHERGLAGLKATPAEARSDAMSSSERDPEALLEKWGGFVAEISPLVSPILLLVRAAAAVEPELAALLAEIDEARLARMKTNADVLARRGFLRKGMSVDRAAEILWTYTSPDLYDLLVVRRGWSAADFGAFVADGLKALLLCD